MKIAMWPLAKLKPYEKNPRRNDPAVETVARSIERFGFRQPIVVDGAGVIIAGHTRYKAARRLKLPRVPVHVAEGLTPEQVQAYRLADNRSAELSGWDDDLLAGELRALHEAEQDLTGLGWTADEISALLSDPAGAAPAGGESQVAPEQYQIIAEVQDAAAQKALFERLTAEGYTCRMLTI